MRVLLVTPPMVAFNAPYAATPLLTAFLRREGVEAHQVDLSLEVALRLFSRRGLEEVLATVRRSGGRRSESVRSFLRQSEARLQTVDAVIRSLQTEGPFSEADAALACSLPRGPRFRVLEEMRRVGGDPRQAAGPIWPRYLASLYLDDLADAVREGVDARFGLSWYGSPTSLHPASFSQIRQSLEDIRDGLLDRILQERLVPVLERVRPDLVGITVPFAGTVLGAFRVAQIVKARRPDTAIVVGGGWVNTEWRALREPGVFDFFDFIAYDDGEQPLLRITRYLEGRAETRDLVRTRLRIRGRVRFFDAAPPPLPHRERPAPVYDGLPLSRYCRVVETLNPMARLWTERCWMRFALAHGCYWHRCAFCDTSLDAIRRYDPADAEIILGWMLEARRQTGLNGFHFVDEAAPPALLQRLADAILERGLNVEWWVNVRLEPGWTPTLAAHLARAGCVAVTGGLECAEENGLRLLRKGIALPSATRAMAALTSAGILMHAYLMYGIPGETLQETVDALDVVRQLFREGCLHSAYWHRFALSVHSPMFRERRRWGLRLGRRRPALGENEVPFTSPPTVRSDRVGRALNRAVYNYMLGVGWDAPVESWFDLRVPKPRIPPDAVRRWVEASPGVRTPTHPSKSRLRQGGRTRFR